MEAFSKNTVVILGAGSSRAIGGEEYPLMNDFFDKIIDFGLADRLDLVKSYFIQKYNLDIFNLKSTGFNIEDLFTFLELDLRKFPDDPNLNKVSMDLINCITEFLVKLSSSKYKNDTLYNGWMNFVQKKLSKATVISFNWDLLMDHMLGMEYLLKEIENDRNYSNQIKETQYYNFVHYISDYRHLFVDHERKPVTSFADRSFYLKLHGSVNWKYCANKDCSSYNMVFPVFSPLKEHYCNQCMEKMHILLIPPILHKELHSFPFIRKLWNVAIEKLKKADEVIIFGYSLPDTDFYAKWLFFKASNRLDKLVIIDPNSEGLVDKFVSIFKLTSKSKNTYCFASFEDYIDWGNFLCPR